MPREKQDWTLMEFLYTAAKVSYEFEHRVTYSNRVTWALISFRSASMCVDMKRLFLFYVYIPRALYWF